MAPMPMHVVDCGSGGTRFETFSKHPGDGLIRVDHRAKLPGVIVKVMATVVPGGECSRELASWFDALDAVMKETGRRCRCPVSRVFVIATSVSNSAGVIGSPVMIGCTAGVRDALRARQITQEQVDGFQVHLRERFGERAGFHVLEGEQEGLLELGAARYCLTQVLPPGSEIDPGEVGVISSGGASSQIVYPKPDGGRPTALSLETKLKDEGNMRLLSVGVQYGLKMYDSHLDGVVANVALGHSVPLRGNFVAIEILAHVGKRCGIEKRIVSNAEARQSIERYLEEWTPAILDEEKRGELREWRDVMGGPSALQALRLLSLLDPDAKLYFADRFEIAPGQALKPAWGLGWYLVARTAYGG